MISTGIVIIWPSQNNNIPQGFVRETALDGKFLKGNGENDPGDAGGNPTHSHTSPEHTHTMVAHTHNVATSNNFNDSYRGSGAGSSACDVHAHNGPVGGVVGGSLVGTLDYGAVSNNPPFFEVIFIRATNFRLVPAGAILLWASSLGLDGYSDCDGVSGRPALDSKYLRGAAAGQDAGTTGGSLTNNHPINHGHSNPSHSHSAPLGSVTSANRDLGVGDGPSKAPASHTHQVTLNSQSEAVNNFVGTLGELETVEPLHKKLRALINVAGRNLVPKAGLIALWLGDVEDIPAGWVLCDGENGTPDLTDHFVKITTNGDLVNSEAGSNTHTHAAQNHNHTAAGSHTHGGSIARFEAITGGTQNQSVNAVRQHDHSINSIGSATSAWNQTTTTADEANNEPEYMTVAFVMMKFSTQGGGGAQDPV